MTTYVFPGQGSQAVGMGEALFSEFPEYIQKADNILGYSLQELCLKDPHEQLNQTQFTQPALYVVNALSYLKKVNETPEKPDYVMGHSLGEYNALFAANVFDFETGLKLVKKRGELMSQAKNGGMAAILGLKSVDVQNLLNEHNLKEVTIANYNSYTQVVITGPQDAVLNTQTLFEKANARLFLPLKVSGAFHSIFMKKAEEEFTGFLKDFTFNEPSIPVIANVNAKPYPSTEISSLLAQQITKPVLWTESVEYILGKNENNFIEIGPGKVLTGLIRRIQTNQ